MGRAVPTPCAWLGPARIVVADIDFQIDAVPYNMNSPYDVETTVDLITDSGGEAFAVKCDVRDAAQVDAPPRQPWTGSAGSTSSSPTRAAGHPRLSPR